MEIKGVKCRMFLTRGKLLAFISLRSAATYLPLTPLSPEKLYIWIGSYFWKFSLLSSPRWQEHLVSVQWCRVKKLTVSLCHCITVDISHPYPSQEHLWGGFGERFSGQIPVFDSFDANLHKLRAILPWIARKSRFCQSNTGNYDWWALIQVWAQQGHKDYLDIPDMGYGVDADETVSPKSLTELDKKWVTRTFGDIYNDKDSRVIITRLKRHPDEKKSYLSLPDDNELARLCDKIVDFLNKHIDFSSWAATVSVFFHSFPASVTTKVTQISKACYFDGNAPFFVRSGMAFALLSVKFLILLIWIS